MEFVKIFLIVVVSVLFIKYVIFPTIEKLKFRPSQKPLKDSQTEHGRIPDTYFMVTTKEYPSYIENEDIKIEFSFVYKIDFDTLQGIRVGYRDGRKDFIMFHLDIDEKACTKKLKAAWEAYKNYSER